MTAVPDLIQPAWTRVDPHTCQLGESPFWHPQEQCLYWVDISGKQLLRMHAGVLQTWDMPSEPGCIAPARSGGLVIALRHGIFRARQWGGDLLHIASLPYDPATVRANDGKCDALGRFWVGTVDESKTAHAAALFSVDARDTGAPARITQHASGALTGNGLGFSPDHTRAYWVDTPTHGIDVWDFDLPSNTLRGQRRFAQFAPKPAGWQFTDSAYGGRPDGAAVDAQGNYWVAMYEGARLCQFAPDGRLLAQFATPAQCPTMPCFGGPDLQTLYLTTVRHGRSDAELARYPDAGCVFSMPAPLPGLPVHLFAD
ncbi:MAG: SMP-30/gluconolactonase/LRE family protein [Betaproteobacteria bacterium]|nr:SMP-30/gluconolactonase/LRE family protein [Betaproteobacteria bacterium]